MAKSTGRMRQSNAPTEGYNLAQFTGIITLRSGMLKLGFKRIVGEEQVGSVLGKFLTLKDFPGEWDLRLVNEFFKAMDFDVKYEFIKTIVRSPIKITFIPAQGTFAHSPKLYDDNLFVHDITGYPLDKERLERSFEAIIESKGPSATAAARSNLPTS